MKTLKVNVDSLKKSNWTESELKNVALIADFVQKVMNEHDFDYVQNNFGNNSYKQHNRNMSDGMKGVVQAVKDLVKTYPAYSYDVKHISVDGNYVHFHSHATLKEKHRGNSEIGLNIKDTWLVENGEIVEHWDAIQPINGFMRFYALMVGGKVANDNSLF